VAIVNLVSEHYSTPKDSVQFYGSTTRYPLGGTYLYGSKVLTVDWD